MAFNTTSYFAGIGTVALALSLGFAGGAKITSDSGMEQQNRLQRISSSTPPSGMVEANAGSKVTPFESPIAPIAAIDMARSQPVVQRTESTPLIQPSAPPPPVVADNGIAGGEVARDDDREPKAELTRADAKADLALARQAELKRIADKKRTEARKWEERRKRQEIQSAANAVRQMKADGVLQTVVERDEGPRLGFFSND